MQLHIHRGCKDLIAELSLPEFLVFYYMGVPVSVGEVNVEVFDLLRNLLLQSSPLLLDSDDVLVGCPVSLDVLESLLEEEWQIFGLSSRKCHALYVDMRVILGELLEENHLQVIFIKGLDQTLLVVT
jgi:hypothetical protein